MWGQKRFLDKDTEAWHIACWAWLLRNLDGLEALLEAPLVLPTAEFYGRMPAEGHARAEALFVRTKELMGVADWPCTLVPREETNAELGEFWRLQPEGKGVAGTFEARDGQITVTYAPDLLDRPFNLITTFAHELAHYIIHGIAEAAPGADAEPLLEELATDLSVSFFGYGVIGANAAFDFEQFQEAGRQGWRGGAWGYLSEDGWLFALAVFMALRGDDPAIVRPHIKPRIAKRFDEACAYVARQPDMLAPLRAL